MQIGSRTIGKNHPPFIIAELSGNHNQSIDNALKLVQAAADCGVDAIKLQTFTPDSMTLNLSSEDFIITDQKSNWYNQQLYELYKKAYTPWEWHETIFNEAKNLGLEFFSSPFDLEAVDFLDDLSVTAFKIASFENNHIPLIEKAASTGKPMIISTGMASVAEIDMAVSTAREAGCDDLTLLKCTSSYPADPSYSNISTIPHLRELFNAEVGISDHTLGIGVSIASVSFGATIIEKHFTLCRDDGGVDSAFSLEPEEMKLLVNETKNAWKSIGKIQYGASKIEQSNSKFRRSIYISQDIKAGERFSDKNLVIIRPAKGENPSFFNKIIGKVCPKDIKAGTPLKLDNLLS